MMKILRFPTKEEAQEALVRPTEQTSEGVMKAVREIFFEVRRNGDSALRSFTQQFDGVYLQSFSPSAEARTQASDSVAGELREAIRVAEANISSFHSAQRQEPISIETAPGIWCERRAVPIERVGLYIPGGTAPLFSTLLMLAVPAKLAGCREIVLMTPPPIHSTILAVSEMLEISEVYQIGGAQAIAALAYGTESVRSVAKIFGPGNQFVTAAKQLAAQTENVAIDMPAGPSELLVIADSGANPRYIAADLLSQAEHGIDSQVVFITDSEELLQEVNKALSLQTADLPRKDIATIALGNSVALLVKDIEEALSLSNAYAPEHLIIATRNADELKDSVVNAGSVFLGYYTPESLGDYASGTNHTLPTGGASKAYSGVSLDSFLKQITFQTATREGLQALGPVVEAMSAAEGLEAHKRAITVRYQ